LTPAVLDLDWVETEKRIVRFISDYVKESKAKGIVLGLSGGIDSSTVAALSSQAIGGHRVLGVMLPERETYNAKDTKLARIVAEKFGLKTKTIDITNTLQAFYDSAPIFDPADKAPTTFPELTALTKLFAELAVFTALFTADGVVPRADAAVSLTPGIPVADAKAPNGLLLLNHSKGGLPCLRILDMTATYSFARMGTKKIKMPIKNGLKIEPKRRPHFLKISCAI
jgi:hypothetical protein